MFGPNTHIKSQLKVSYSHRDNEFFDLYKDTIRRFKKIFNLNNYDILFIPGSGTVGIESVIYSLKGKIQVIGNKGVFFKRWESMINTYKKSGNEYTLYCQLETSNSSYFECNENCIVDCISSFPYYSIPKSTNIFITCANKQLGSYPGLAIVGVKKSFWDHLKTDNEMSYLNLRRYFKYGELNQTPSTAPTQLFKHFNSVLETFNLNQLKTKIKTNSELLTKSIGINNIIGDITGPVITVHKDIIPIKIASKYQLYGINTNSKYYQIFTYSCEDKLYIKFCKELKK